MATNLTLIDSSIGSLDDFMSSLNAKDNLETLVIILNEDQDDFHDDDEIVQ